MQGALAKRKKREQTQKEKESRNTILRRKLISMLMQGHSYNEISQALGLSLNFVETQIQDYVKNQRQLTKSELANKVAIESASLDYLESKLWSLFETTNDVGYAGAILRAKERRAKLLGLDRVLELVRAENPEEIKTYVVVSPKDWTHHIPEHLLPEYEQFKPDSEKT